MQRSGIVRLRLAVLACIAAINLAVGSTAHACSDTNTCYGTGALASNKTGVLNSGFGYEALYNNTLGYWNTAVGARALHANTTANWNVAIGYEALYGNTTGFSNTASGYQALRSNTNGIFNTGTGHMALYNTTTGEINTANGASALYSNTTGYWNTAIGVSALQLNTTGYYNTASGVDALYGNLAGSRNTADGVAALYNATGSRNVALGYNAGYNILGGGDNIIVGAGQKGKPADNGVIRIGSSFQKRAFIAGIRGVTTGLANAVPVVIDGNGQLGTISSSRRVKEDIQPMGSVSERLLDLHPVTFRYKQPTEDGETPLQFGLVAEEVAEVFPELVVYGKNGEPETVSYHLLATLLLNEFQKERSAAQAQATELAQLKGQLAAMAAVIERLEQTRMVATNH